MLVQFKCGGANSDGCKKKLSLVEYTAHKHEPYCKTCYTNLFGPKGFVGGSATINTFSPKGGDVVNDRHANAAAGDTFAASGSVKARMANFQH